MMELLVQFLGKFNTSRIMSGGKCARRYTWVDGCKAVEFDDVKESSLLFSPFQQYGLETL